MLCWTGEKPDAVTTGTTVFYVEEGQEHKGSGRSTEACFRSVGRPISILVSQDRVSLCNLFCSVTSYVEQAGSEHRDLPTSTPNHWN